MKFSNLNYSTLYRSVQFTQNLRGLIKKQPQSKEHSLKIFLETEQLTEAVDFLKTRRIRKSTAAKIFSPVSNTSKSQEVVA